MLAPQKRAPHRTTLAPPQEQISHLRQKKSKDGKKIMSLKLRNWSFRNQILAQGKFGSDTYGSWVPA